MHVLLNTAKTKIQAGPMTLPTQWVDKTGTLTDLSVLTTLELANLGWVPYTEMNTKPVATTTDINIDVTHAFFTDRVEATYSVTEFSLTDAKNEIINDINNFRDNLIDGGIIFGTYSFDSDEKAQGNINGVVTAVKIRQDLSQIIDPIPWTTSPNSSVNMTGNEIITFGLSVMTFASTCYVAARAHKNAIIAATTIAEAKAYDYTVGWPSNDLGGTISAP